MPGATSLRELAAGAVGETRAQQLYREDAWTWAQEQADALRRRDVGAIDWENVIEEIEAVGRREMRGWVSHCAKAVSHLLKIEHSRSAEHLDHWRREVGAYRRGMLDALEDSPGLKGRFPEMLDKAWRRGRAEAVEKLADSDARGSAAAEKAHVRAWGRRLPADCPYALEDIAGYDPHDKDAQPQGDAWPAPVARALNEALGTDYPVRHRAPRRETGRSR